MGKFFVYMALALCSFSNATAGLVTFTGAGDEEIWVEDGVTIDPVGGGVHFHGDGSIARSYTSDGTPIEISMGGLPFNLLSIDFNSFGDPMLLHITSNLGGSLLNFNTTGTHDFTLNPGFAGVTLVTLTLDENGAGSERSMVWDNVLTGAVPEPATYALVGTGLGILALLRRRKTFRDRRGQT